MSNRLLAGRYELIEKIGDGGMAIVYKGKDRLLNRYVAIKILRPEYTKDDTFIKNFIKESQAAARLTHPNVVGVYDVGREGNIHYIVMELIDGKPLSDIISSKGRLEYREAIDYTVQIAQALSIAHKNQIVHRDVKPHNVLVTNQGIAKLADFGIAKAVSASTIVGGSEKVMGSVHYFSPEQARGAYVDERSDIYSLGIVLFEMITGHVPFDGDNPVSIALMHINNPIPSVNNEVSGLPPQLERIIHKATEKYQSNRYKSVDDMIDDLKAISYISGIMGDKAFPNYYQETKSDDAASNNSEDIKKYAEAINDITDKHKNGREISKKETVSKTKKFLNFADKGALVLTIAGTIVVAVVGIVLLGYMLGWFDKSEDVEVPQFIGMEYDAAVTLANSMGLQIERGEDVFSAEYDEGLVSSQSPSKGANVTEGKIVTVNVSKGKREGIMPTLEGYKLEEATKIIEEYGFILGTVETVNSHEDEGTIIYQSIKAGASASKGSTVNLEISDGKGEEMIIVPNLIDQTPENANTLLESLGLEIGEVTYEETDDVFENLIFWQSEDPNSSVPKGTKIDYKASKGTKPEGSGSSDETTPDEDTQQEETEVEETDTPENPETPQETEENDENQQ